MEAMTEEARRAEGARRWQETFTGWRDAAAAGLIPGDESEEGTGRGILSVDRRQVADVWLTFGGPSALVRFIHVDGEVSEGTYITSEADYGRRGFGVDDVTIPLDEAQEAFDLLGLGQD